MRRSAFGFVLGFGMTLLPVAPRAADNSDLMATSAFRAGHADRQAWETWFDNLSGSVRAGAEFWASHRSDPNPPACTSTSDVAFRSGCEEAQKRLAPSDRRRRAEADYKAGWNSSMDASPAATAETPQADGGCRLEPLRLVDMGNRIFERVLFCSGRPRISRRFNR